MHGCSLCEGTGETEEGDVCPKCDGEGCFAAGHCPCCNGAEFFEEGFYIEFFNEGWHDFFMDKYKVSLIGDQFDRADYVAGYQAAKERMANYVPT